MVEMKAVSSQFGQIQYSDHIRRSMTKLADWKNAPFNAVFITHSIGAGVGALPATLQGYHDNNFIAIMRDEIGRAFGTTVFEGPSNPSDYLLSPVAGSGGLSTLTNTTATFGSLGFFAGIGLSAANQSIGIPVVGQYHYIYNWAAFASGSPVAPPTVTSDGSPATVTVISTPQQGAIVSGGGSSYLQKLRVDCGSAGAHTLVISGTVAGGISVLFVDIRGVLDTVGGIAIGRHGRSGAVLADVLAIAALPTDSGPATIKDYTDAQKTIQLYTMSKYLSSDLTGLMFDVNDIAAKSGSYGYAYDPIRIQDNVQRTVNSLIAQNTDVLLIAGPWRNPANAGYTLPAPAVQQDIAQLYANVAKATDRCAFINVREPYTSWADEDAAGRKFDEVHPSNRGHSAIGRTIARAMIRAAA